MLTKKTPQDALYQSFLQVVGEILSDGDHLSDRTIQVARHGLNAYLGVDLLPGEYNDQIKEIARMHLDYLHINLTRKQLAALDRAHGIDDHPVFS